MTTSEKPVPWGGFLLKERGVFTGILGAVFVLGLVLAGIVCYIHPRKYESRCVVEPGAMPGLTIGATDPETVCAIMKSKENLIRVAEDLDLTKRWGYDSESTCEILQSTVSAKVQANGKLVDVTVTLGKPEDARDIAAAVVRAWGKQMRDAVTTHAKEAITHAQTGAEVHQLNADQFDKELAACLARQPENPAVPAGIREKRDRERALEQAMRAEVIRLTALRDIQHVPLVIHEQPVFSRKPVLPDVPALFGRWATGALLTGLCLALPAAAMAQRAKQRRAASERLDSGTAAEPNW